MGEFAGRGPLLLGLSRRRAASLCRPSGLPRTVGSLTAVGLVSFTNLMPAVLFVGWPGCWTVAVGVIELFTGGGDGLGQAAALGVIAVGLNLVAVGLFWVTAGALWEPE